MKLAVDSVLMAAVQIHACDVSLISVIFCSLISGVCRVVNGCGYLPWPTEQDFESATVAMHRRLAQQRKQREGVIQRIVNCMQICRCGISVLASLLRRVVVHSVDIC